MLHRPKPNHTPWRHQGPRLSSCASPSLQPSPSASSSSAASAGAPPFPPEQTKEDISHPPLNRPYGLPKSRFRPQRLSVNRQITGQGQYLINLIKARRGVSPACSQPLPYPVLKTRYDRKRSPPHSAPCRVHAGDLYRRVIRSARLFAIHIIYTYRKGGGVIPPVSRYPRDLSRVPVPSEPGA